MTEPRTAVRRLALARVISVTGSAAAYTALMFEIYDQTGSSVWLAASLLVTEGVSGLVGPFASVLGDRFDRRTVMIVSDLAAAACFAGMAMVASAPGPLVFIAFLSALAEAPFWPASSAAIPNLVPSEQVGWANSLVAIGRNIGIMVGPAIGGILLAAAGAPWVFAINAVSFVLSAALVVSVRARFVGDRSDEGEHKGVWAGFRFLFHEPVLRRISVAWVVLVLGIGMAMVGDVPLVDVFDAGSAGFGLMIGLWGAGSILGSLAGRWLSAATEMRWLVLGDRVRRVHRRRDRALAVVRARPGPERRLGSGRGDHGRRRAEPVPAPNTGLGPEPGPRRSRGCSTAGWPSRTSRRRSCSPWWGPAGCTRSQAWLRDCR
jgi:MFS family permease